MSFDAAIIETLNGGDLQQVGSDLAVVYGIENMVYLAMFGGNTEASTSTKVVTLDSKDWWGNSVLMPNDASTQFNSLTERTLKTTALTSAGRVIIENAVKKDLDFFKDLGATVTVSVSIIDTDHIRILIRIELEQEIKIITVNFRKATDGDFFIMDFNSTDFLI